MSARSHQSASSKGFTLVELLVVIGIIALLISILLPSLSKARASAQSVVCQSNARQVVVGISMYTNDHRLYVPDASAIPDWNAGLASNGGMWVMRLVELNYIPGSAENNEEGKDTFRCPADQVTPSDFPAWNGRANFTSYKGLGRYGWANSGEGHRLLKMPGGPDANSPSAPIKYLGVDPARGPVPMIAEVVVNRAYSLASRGLAAPFHDVFRHPSTTSAPWNASTSTPHPEQRRTVLYNDFSVGFGYVAYQDPTKDEEFTHPMINQ